MITGAPKTGVTALSGMIVFSGSVHTRLQTSAMMLPERMVAGSRMTWFDVRVMRRAMCGTASPMNATGPQNAVAAAERMPVEMSMRRRV